MSMPSETSIGFDTANVAHQAALLALSEATETGAPLITGVDSADRAIQIAERLRRLAAVTVVDTMQAIDASRIFVDQGHSSARTMVGHLAGLSGADAFRMDRVRRMVHGDRADHIARSWAAGELGVDQAVLLGKVYANRRVRDRFIDDQVWFLAQARKLSWKRFERKIARWVELADDDGSAPAADPTHESRAASLSQDHFSTAWHLRAQLGSAAGSRFNEVFAAYVDAEFKLDWDNAQAVHGDATTLEVLERTDAQRRADALCQMAEDAAANTASSVRVKRVHNIVWQGDTAEELFRRWNGLPLQRLSPDDYGVTDLDGHPIHAPSAIAELVTGSFRRVVQDAAGITIDLSVEQRFFTGLTRLGVELQTDECYWPGCHRPVTQCHIDHLRPAARGGPTTQMNGAPACPTHNWRKEAGYLVCRGSDGTITITTPTGETVR
jgi:hypothetical protein